MFSEEKNSVWFLKNQNKPNLYNPYSKWAFTQMENLEYMCHKLELIVI